MIALFVPSVRGKCLFICMRQWLRCWRIRLQAIPSFEKFPMGPEFCCAPLMPTLMQDASCLGRSQDRKKKGQQGMQSGYN